MSEQPSAVPPVEVRRLPLPAVLAVVVTVAACAIYANLSFAVTDGADYRYFPPFRRNVNMNRSRHLGAEYVNIARSLRAGRGFADPFARPTGPTAWMPPALPAVLAGLLWA